MSILSLVIASFIAAFLSAFLLTPLAIKFAYKFNLVDDPKKNKHPKVVHTYPVPRGGGLAIFLAILVAGIMFLPFDKHLIGILSGALILCVLGLVDDKYNLNPYLRLAIQFVCATVPVLAGIGIAYINNPLGTGIIDLSQNQLALNFLGNHSLWLIADLFAILWIVLLMNFLNMGAKGVDGQLPGVVAVAGATIAVLSLKFSADITEWPVTILAVITTGAYLGFLPYNFFPQKIMPGFSGSTLAGYLLGILSILSTTKVGTLLVVLGIPLIDTGYTVIRRVLSGKSPVWGDRGHLHHRLLEMGLSKKQVTYFYWIATIILGVLSLFLTSTFKLYTIVGVAVLLGGFLLWLTYRSKL
ncbi:MAG: UDP-N-acetylmuramyl pentapeptide phosphotransferase/UDP-N-acetylglucosamine-1-phosphate transferase [Candidatus Woesebacteria bacterium GW2011_GWA1_39_21]|uniref:UDP-N-acetylmuramyl pentapeptide phosphotransferase/UDP-N-acetylglucosamine-1-phosphate transferase n=1 Tax=Candidatus Woesebacteria bacterium GW2011_GWA1_39_21 TaxID=1618550 RepID=A0A0G0QMN3_9BACT|nr:MAG: UDP-N-acetylmuramyl pentapeptide phosphotransferase/UDP-N-acetylglucosamine-1-phosphate transferase [Candidatus Woesebacteria bacterium GW2011_GWA1_39_21]